MSDDSWSEAIGSGEPGLRPIVNPSWVLREESGGEAILFDADTGEIWLANRTTVAIWRLLDGSCGVPEIIDALHAQFPDMGPDGNDQVMAVLRELSEVGAVGAVGIHTDRGR